MTDADEQLIRQRAAALRVLALAILVGAVTIIGVFVALLYLGFDGKPILGVPAGVPLVTLIGLLAGLSSVALSFVIPGQVRRAAAARLAAGRPVPAQPGDSPAAGLAPAYASSLIVGMALAEGGAVMGAIFFLMEGHWLALLPAGLGILSLIWMFPSEAALRGWVEDQLAELPDRPNYPPAA
jgi:hypothetical protein